MLYVTNYLFFLVVIGSSFILSDLVFNVHFFIKSNLLFDETKFCHNKTLLYLHN